MADEPLSRVGKGDRITADWANAVADAVNARGASDPNSDGTATPYGVMTPAEVDTQMRPPDAQAMAFDCVIVRSGAEDFLWIALPDSPDYVYLQDRAISPDSAQTVGTAQNAFVQLEKVTNGTARGIYLAFAARTNEGSGEEEITGWRVYADALGASRPEWASETAPVVLLASYNIAADDTSGEDTAPGDVPSLQLGLVQYWRGTVVAPYTAPDPDAPEPEEPPPCGNPLNAEGEDDSHPLDSPPRPGSGGGTNTSITGNPLDGEGEGGFTPLCREDANLN